MENKQKIVLGLIAIDIIAVYAIWLSNLGISVDVLYGIGFLSLSILFVYLARISTFSPKASTASGGQGMDQKTNQPAKDLLFDMTTEQLFDKIKEAALDIKGLKCVSSDVSSGSIVLKRGVSGYSMGENLIAIVKPAGKYKTVEINAKIQYYGLVAQMRAQKDVDMIYQALSGYAVKGS
jgi:hypothetical protein